MSTENAPITLVEPFNPRDVTKLTPSEIIRRHVLSREGYFLSILSSVAARSKTESTGRQRISQDSEGLVKKQVEPRAELSPESLFTGSQWCLIASIALSLGIEKFAEQHLLSLVTEIGELSTNMYGENWLSTYRSGVMFHDIVKVRDANSSEFFYFDPTYAQINHIFTGRIIRIPAYGLPYFYQSKQVPIGYKPETNLDDSQSKIDRATWTISHEELDQVVNTLLD